MGLLMMAGYGICNAIIEIDTAVETFDYNKYNIIERCTYLIQWCKQYLPKHKCQNKSSSSSNTTNNNTEEEDIDDKLETARVLINLRDFTNLHRSSGGLEQTLYFVDQLCRLSEHERPFGFIMEDPTGWLFPDEVAKLVRLIRVTMNRAGHRQGKFLVHLHMYFGLAEACVLSALCNGADGKYS